jgi:hypothetical protein
MDDFLKLEMRLGGVRASRAADPIGGGTLLRSGATGGPAGLPIGGIAGS